MKKIIAFVALAGISVAFSGCSQKPADPAKATTVAKPDLGEPGGAVEMHDESKGKSTISKPAPAPADNTKPAPAPTPEPAAKDSKAEFNPAPEPAKKAETTDTKKGNAIDDKTDDKDEEEQK